MSVLDLLRPGASLTSLDVANLQVNNFHTRMLVETLVQNNTITNLIVGACIFSPGLKGSAHKFAEYLAKGKPTLRKLTMTADHSVDREGLKIVVQAIPQATVLEEVVANLRFMEPEEMAFFAQVVQLSQSVRSLTVTRSKCCERFTTTYLDELMFGTGRDKLMQPWLSALTKNTVLSKLAIDLQGFGAKECCDFFRTVAASNTLQRVIVRNISVFKDLRESLSQIESSLLSRKVLIDDLHVRPLNIPALPQCTLVTAVTLSYNHIERVHEFRSALSVLMKCPHITSLSVHTLTDMYEANVQNDIAEYIRVASTLKNFELRLPVGFYVLASQDERCASHLIKALASNTNLQKITLIMTLSKMDCQTLAHAAFHIPTLSELSLVNFGYCVNECFIPFFARGMANNYNLLRVELSDCGMYDAENIIVQDFTRRNCALIARAARFVMGDRDPFCARAREPVSIHAKLVELVQDKAGAETTEAVAMTRRALISIRGMDEYMGLSGVVKYSVQCFDQRDGGTLTSSSGCKLHCAEDGLVASFHHIWAFIESKEEMDDYIKEAWSRHMQKGATATSVDHAGDKVYGLSKPPHAVVARSKKSRHQGQGLRPHGHHCMATIQMLLILSKSLRAGCQFHGSYIKSWILRRFRTSFMQKLSLQKLNLQKLSHPSIQGRSHHLQVHLANSVTVSKEVYEMLMAMPKESHFVKRAATAIWSSGVLAKRSFSGALSNRFLTDGSDKAPQKPLTPRKVDALKGTMRRLGGFLWRKRTRVPRISACGFRKKSCELRRKRPAAK
ncbi:hypothetical protein MTO96_036174 [Rhipicephalus appendiculatus]